MRLLNYLVILRNYCWFCACEGGIVQEKEVKGRMFIRFLVWDFQCWRLSRIEQSSWQNNSGVLDLPAKRWKQLWKDNWLWEHPAELSFPFFFFFFFCTHGMWKFPGQGLNPRHSHDPSCYSDNTGSLTTEPQENFPSDLSLLFPLMAASWVACCPDKWILWKFRKETIQLSRTWLPQNKVFSHSLISLPDGEPKAMVGSVLRAPAVLYVDGMYDIYLSTACPCHLKRVTATLHPLARLLQVILQYRCTLLCLWIFTLVLPPHLEMDMWACRKPLWIYLNVNSYYQLF